MKNIVVFFKPDKKFGEFSNWYLKDFYVNGIKYCCMEQYMMAQKALVFEDDYNYDLIMESTEPSDIKYYGRQVENFNDDIWNKVKYEIIKQGLFNKFNQNEDLKKLLINTNDKFIGECNKFDLVWGTGLTVYDMINNEYDLDKLPGQNLLGKALMEVREELKTRAY